MERQLEEDLIETLEGCDPLELVLQDPDLSSIAQEVLGIWQDTSSVLSDITISSDDDIILSPDSTQNMGSSKIHECVACHRSAGGYCYFGARVCNSCKSFFVRSIKNAKYKTFFCSEDHDKKLNSRSWMKCQFCRFEHLCKVGMKVPQVTAKKSLGFGQGNMKDMVNEHYLCQANKLLGPTATLTKDELSTVEQITSEEIKLCLDVLGKLLKQNTKLFRDQLRAYIHGTPIPIKSLKLAEDFMVYSIQQEFAQSDTWSFASKLKSKDRARLAKANYPLVQEFNDTFKLNQKYPGTNLKKEIELIVECAADGLEDTDRKIIYDIYLEESRDGTVCPGPKTYEMVYDQEDLGISADKEMSLRHRQLVHKIQGMAFMKWDIVSIILNSFIILYTPDFIELDDPEEAQKIQIMYACLLHRYLKDKGIPEADLMFRESMFIIAYVRDLYEIKTKAYRRQKV